MKPAYAILTRPAQPPVSKIHDREPVTLRREQVGDYISTALSIGDLREDKGVELKSREASTDANNPRNKSEAVTTRTTASLEDY